MSNLAISKVEAMAEEPQGSISESRIGWRIKHARLTRGLKLQELADKIDCSVSALSKIENQKANPSITMLHKICAALGTNISALFAGEGQGESVITRASDRPMILTDQVRSGHGIQLQQLVASIPGQLLQGNLHIIQPGGYSNEALQHEGEEMGLVLEGVLELHVAGKVYIAEEGDSFFFRSELPHSYRNPGDRITRVLWVNTPPTF